jgi:hypothetical protein
MEDLRYPHGIEIGHSYHDFTGSKSNSRTKYILK